jgi:hypothetical protein
MSNFEPGSSSPASTPPTVPPPSTVPPPPSGGTGSGGITEQGKQVAGTAAEQGKQVAGTAAQQGKEVAGTAAQQGKEVAGTAAQQGKEVASTAVAGAQQVAGEAKREIADVARTATEEIRGLVGQVGGELRGQASTQTDRLAEGLRSLSSQLQAAGSGQPLQAGPVQDLARQAGSTFDQLSSRLSSGGVDGVVQDVSSFARRKPGLFLAGAASLGFFAGRMLRGAQAASQSGPSGSSMAGTQRSVGSTTSGGYGASAALPPTSTSAPHVSTPATDVVVIDDGTTGLAPGVVPSNPTGGPR